MTIELTQITKESDKEYIQTILDATDMFIYSYVILTTGKQYNKILVTNTEYPESSYIVYINKKNEFFASKEHIKNIKWQVKHSS